MPRPSGAGNGTMSLMKANPTWLTDELLERALGLAWFVLGDRSDTLDAVRWAVNHRDAALALQDKRIKQQSRSRTKAILSEDHVLQRYLLIACERQAKKRRERHHVIPITEEDLLVWWQCDVVQRSLDNSFHLTVAQWRVLHRYETRTARDVFELVLRCEPKDDDQYRRYKARVLSICVPQFHPFVQKEPNGP